jgi:hypothetical protein
MIRPSTQHPEIHMSTQNLSSVALNVVDQYSEAGKTLVHAYRVGSERAVHAVSARFESVLNARSLPLVNETFKANLIGAEQKIAGVVSRGVTLGANGADFTIEQVARVANGGIERLTTAGTRVEKVIGVAAVQKANALALPAANVSLQIANFVAEGSKFLSERVAGAEEIVVPAKKAAKKVARKKPAAKRATRTARSA